MILQGYNAATFTGVLARVLGGMRIMPALFVWDVTSILILTRWKRLNSLRPDWGISLTF